MLRRTGRLCQTGGRRLHRQIGAALRNDRRDRTARVGENIVTELAGGNVQEAFRHLKGWYRAASETQSKPCYHTMERQTSERVDLYARRQSPGDPLPLHLTPIETFIMMSRIVVEPKQRSFGLGWWDAEDQKKQPAPDGVASSNRGLWTRWPQRPSCVTRRHDVLETDHWLLAIETNLSMLSSQSVSLGTFPSTPSWSCSLAGSLTTLFFATFVNRWSNSRATSRRRCWPFGHPVISQTSLLDKFLQKTPGSATIVIMPRRGEILEMTNHEGHSYCAKHFVYVQYGWGK